MNVTRKFSGSVHDEDIDIGGDSMELDDRAVVSNCRIRNLGATLILGAGSVFDGNEVEPVTFVDIKLSDAALVATARPGWFDRWFRRKRPAPGPRVTNNIFHAKEIQ